MIAIASFLMSQAAMSEEIVRVSPQPQIDLNALIPAAYQGSFRTIAMAASSGSLYVLLGPLGTAANAAVLRLDSAGRYISFHEVAGKVADHWIDAHAGRVFLLRAVPGSEEILRLEADGTLTKWATLPYNYSDRKVTGNGVTGVGWSGEVSIMDRSGRAIRSATAGAPGVFHGCSTGSTFLTVDAITGKLYRDDRRPELTSLGIPGLLATYPQPAKSEKSQRELIGSIQCQADDSAYLFVAAYKLSEGAPVLQIDHKGQVKAQYRLMLLLNPFFLPVSMAATDDRAFLLSSRGALVSYNIPTAGLSNSQQLR